MLVVAGLVLELVEELDVVVVIGLVVLELVELVDVVVVILIQSKPFHSLPIEQQ